MCPLPHILFAQFLLFINTSQVKQGILVIWGVIRLDLEILCRDEVVASINDHVD